MTADRFEIIDDGPCIRIVSPDCPTGYHIDDAIIGAIRQQARDLDQLRADLAAAVAERDAFRSECVLLTHKVICCGVAASHSDPLLTTTGAYASIWNSAQAESVRKLRAERDTIRARLAAIDAAPVVAHIANKIGPDYFPCGLTILADSKLPPLGTDLIAKPAKD